MKDEGYFEITIEPMQTPKNKYLNWMFWNIYWKVWNIWRPKFLAWFFLGLFNFFDKRMNND